MLIMYLKARRTAWQLVLLLSAVYSKQSRKYKYNVTLRRVRVPIVAVEEQEVLHILCVSVA